MVGVAAQVACLRSVKSVTKQGMKSSSRFFLLFGVLLCAGVSAMGKPKSKKAPEPAPAEVPADPANPAQALSFYINNLDQLLALQRKVAKNDAPNYEQAAQRMVTLRAGFAAEREKADAAGRPKFDAAMATCDLLARALNERQAVIGDIASSKAVQSSGKMEEGGRKDNLQEGLKGGGLSKAVGTVVERDRERDEEAKAAARNAANNNAMTAMTLNRWTKRSLELKAAVNDSYARIH
jgi:Na+-transporting methylmalonyl-CoA/oxaloacetate decarboxylase gamma subunit